MHVVWVAAPFAAILGLGLSAGCIGGHDYIQNGDRAPDFTVTDLEGANVDTSAARGKLLVLGILHLLPNPVTSTEPFAEDARALTQNMTWLRTDFPNASIVFLTVAEGANGATEANLRELRDWGHANWSFALQGEPSESIDRYFKTGQGIWIISPEGVRLLLDRHPIGGAPANCAHDLVSDYLRGEKVEPHTC